MAQKHPGTKAWQRRRPRNLDTGLAPGTIVYTGPPRDAPVQIRHTPYSEKGCSTKTLTAFDQVKKEGGRHWIECIGIHDVGMIEEAGRTLGIHPLFLEDIANPFQRPKFEPGNDHIFFSCKMVRFIGNELLIENVSFVAAESWVLSFEEVDGDVFGGVRERFQKAGSRLLTHGGDYLLYALIDSIVDHYFLIIEKFGDRLEQIETALEGNIDKSLLLQIQQQKREHIRFRKAVTPLREAVAKMMRSEHELITDDTQHFLHDLLDHLIYIQESIDSQREYIATLNDSYTNLVGMKMNQVMQTLTIVATIFIPLTFIAGIYGMNFDRMPELHWRYGYPAAMILMLLILIAMLFYFRRKGWLND